MRSYLSKEAGSLPFAGSSHGLKADRIVDGSGLFLTPGLIDSHVHLYNVTGMNFRAQQANPEMAAAHFEQQPKSYLYFGYTTLIELNARREFNAQFEATPLHPDVCDCFRSLVLADGFGISDFPAERRYDIRDNLSVRPLSGQPVPGGAVEDRSHAARNRATNRGRRRHLC